MIHRTYAAFCTALVLFFLLGPVAAPTHAQEAVPTYRQLTMEASRLLRPATLMARGRLPAHIDSLGGPQVVAVGETASFEAFTNASSAALPMYLHWDFNDGTGAKGLHAQHRFGTPGSYTVTFTFANRHATVTDSLQVRVVRPQVEQ